MARLSSTTLPEVTFRVLDDYVPPAGTVPQSVNYYQYVKKTAEEIDSHIEYDMDEEDFAWLELINESRIKDGLETISEDVFELAMDRFEKESVFQCEFSTAEGGRQADVDEDAACSVCGSGDVGTDNNILFCDLCNIAVHQVCYGVPRVPAGPWACRRCTLSPSRPVDCCLCPNGADGGAMKPTDDGRWAHVSCALWIPEVEFGCKSVREPVINVEKVAAARWKLLCVVCRRRGGGACLQCRRTSCYTAFHVSCATHAGLCVGTPTSDDDVTVFCDVHSSPGSNPDTQSLMSSARKTLSELQNSGPALSVPVLTTAGFGRIQQKLSLDKIDPFVSRLHCYWTLKRRSRNGAPLLRSMLYSYAHLARQRLLDGENQGLEEMVAQLKCWKRLRQDLEKARLLLELIRKRERMKNEQVRIESELTTLRLWPLMTLLSRTVDELYRLDCDGVLLSDSESSGRSSQRVFLSTVRQRIASHSYRSMDEFSSDVSKLLDNVPKTSALFKDKVNGLLETVSKLADAADYEVDTGTHTLHNRTARKSDSRVASRVESKKPSVSGTGRPRGRPKKVTVEQSKQANDRQVSGADSLASSEQARKSQTSSSVAGVNRRTAVLFGNKTARRRVTQSPGSSAAPRRPGRPPKQQTLAVRPTDKEHEDEEPADEVVPKRRGRKKREPSGSGEFGSRWGKVVGSIEWNAVAHPQTSVSTRRTPQKESFRQYRVMDDSDAEGAPRSDTGGQMMSTSSSSASSDNNSSSHSDDNDASSTSTSSSSSPTHTSAQERRSHSRAQDMTTELKPLDLVWAKCKGYPWYPAQIIDPEMPRDGIVDGSVTVEAPPEDVLELRQKYTHQVFLVVFYDTRRTWRWLPRRKLDPLGTDSELDNIKLTANNKANVCAAVQRAYDRACQQKTPAVSQTRTEAD